MFPFMHSAMEIFLYILKFFDIYFFKAMLVCEIFSNFNFFIEFISAFFINFNFFINFDFFINIYFFINITSSSTSPSSSTLSSSSAKLSLFCSSINLSTPLFTAPSKLSNFTESASSVS